VLSKSLIEKILMAVLRNGGDFAEVFVEKRYDNRISMKQNLVEKAISGNEFGVGIRGFLGDKAVYAYSNDVSETNLISVAERVGKTLGEIKIKDTVLNFNKVEYKENNRVFLYPNDIDKKEKILNEKSF